MTTALITLAAFGIFGSGIFLIVGFVYRRNFREEWNDGDAKAITIFAFALLFSMALLAAVVSARLIVQAI